MIVPMLKRQLRRLRPRGIVLLYHRVVTIDADPQCLAVAPDRFSEQMEILRREFQPMPLREMLNASTRSRLPKRAVAVTFDDGYADNLLYAKPILERNRVPATIFVATRTIGQSREFWWDELGALILENPHLPVQLKLSGGFVCAFGADSPRSAAWNILSSGSDSPRQAAYRELCRRIRTLPITAREALMDEIVAAIGTIRSGRDSHRVMSADELRAIGQDGLIELGAHTVNHPVLSSLDPACQREEIAGSKRRLEEVIGRSVPTFSYPYGTTDDYNTASVDAARDLGFEYACSNFEGPVNVRVNPFEVPRCLVRDWNGDEFKRRLEGWFS